MESFEEKLAAFYKELRRQAADLSEQALLLSQVKGISPNACFADVAEQARGLHDRLSLPKHQNE